MNNEIKEFIYKTDDPEVNFNLALKYDEQGQKASALSFYLRAAEKSDDPELQYQALILGGLCLEYQNERPASTKGMYQQAITVLPYRPEAFFFISRLHERNQEYLDSYTFACIGLDLCSLDEDRLPFLKEYPGVYGLQFEKAVVGWWIGRVQEARLIFYNLKLAGGMDEIHTQAVERNLINIGYPDNIFCYNKSEYPLMKYKFPSSADIEKNYSQIYQDLFVLTVLNGKKKGTYLEIGCNDPYRYNNTALLEEQFGWKGLSLDIDKQSIKDFQEKRHNTALLANAVTVNYKEILEQNMFDHEVDYLQLDCEPVTYEAMMNIPFDDYKFAVITFEHDAYLGSDDLRQKSREFLRSKGYVLLVADVCFYKDKNFEDWWVHPDLVPPEVITKLAHVNGNILAKDYLFNKEEGVV